MIARSNRAEVRNPVLALPAAKAIVELLADNPELSAAFRDLLKELSSDMADRGERAWNKSKAPMATYWKSGSIIVKHIRRAISR